MWKGVLNFVQEAAYGKRTDSVAILLGLAVLLFVVYILRNIKRRNLPPGPIGLPILGYYPFFGKNPTQMLHELAKKYGNVFGLYLGPQYVVFLNDWEAVKDGLGQTRDRPEAVFAEVPYRFGFAGSNGAEWAETRRLVSKVLKDGLQRNNWEDLVQMEISESTHRIAQECRNPIEVRSFFSESFANNIISLVLGDRLKTEDLPSKGKSVTKLVSRSVNLIMECTRTFDMINFSQMLAKVLRMLGLEETTMLEKRTEEFSKFVSNTVDSTIRNSDTGKRDSFITRFNEEIENRKKIKEKTYVTEEMLKGTVLSLMVGGSETTRTSILWTLIAMADHPDKQTKVHEELDRVIGREGSIRWSDRSMVPYTLATLLESMRWKTTAPFPGVRIITRDTQIQGYYVPKGTFIASNFWSLHNDPRYWEHPEQFVPERFLLDGGRKVNMAPDSFVPFSYGKRNCPGKLLALMNMLQYFSALMQKFEILPKEGDRVGHGEVLGLSFQARDAELRFIPR